MDLSWELKTFPSCLQRNRFHRRFIDFYKATLSFLYSCLNVVRICGVWHYTLCLYFVVMLNKYYLYDNHANKKSNIKQSTNMLLKYEKLTHKIHWFIWLIYYFIIIFCYHYYICYLQMYTRNKTYFWSFWCRIHTVVTVYDTCNNFFQENIFLFLH